MRVLVICCVLALAALVSADGPSNGPRASRDCPIEGVPVIPFPQTNDGCTICDPRSGPSCPQSLFLNQMEGFWKCKYDALKAQLTGQLSMLSALADIPPAVFAAHPALAPLPQCMNPVLTRPAPTPQNPFAVEIGTNTTLRALFNQLTLSSRGRRSNANLVRDAWCKFANYAGSYSPPLFTNYDIFNPVAPNMTRPALIHNHAGGVPLNTMFIYQSLTEYLAILSAPLGTAGFGGRYLASTFIDLVLDGKVLHRMEGELDGDSNGKGTFYSTTTGDFSPMQKATEYVCPPDVAPGSNSGGCLLLEYGHFPPTHLAHLLDFGVFTPTENITRDFKAGYQLLAQAATQIGANCYPNGFPTADQIGAALGLPRNQPQP